MQLSNQIGDRVSVGTLPGFDGGDGRAAANSAVRGLGADRFRGGHAVPGDYVEPPRWVYGLRAWEHPNDDKRGGDLSVYIDFRKRQLEELLTNPSGT